ncbi:LysR family transcriptional regulator [Erwinia tasmaniensis]|uniref:LysR family transcriptional regulator n=1 Tax=Erwinia tasmaniensis TaxID=338565 RepID=UPI00031322C4|nr:LysR family transcriptional regulator [Erwinia tasmaniensis]
MAINFTLAQIEAFTCVCECGNLTRAAVKLGKDRTTVSELLDYLELDLGYSLFDRSSRPFGVTERGSLLYRQARLFLHEAQAFSQIAQQQEKNPPRTMTLSYDIFTPRTVLSTLASRLYQQGCRLNLCYQDRQQAEAALAEGSVDIALYQAVNKAVGERFKWRGVGSVELAVYASPQLFEQQPVSLLKLASCHQIIPNMALDLAVAQRVQIADRVQYVNDMAMLELLLANGQGWALLPVHIMAGQRSNIIRIETEMGSGGLVCPMVAIWVPGRVGHPLRQRLPDLIAELFARA